MLRDLFLQAAPALLSMLTLGLIALAAWVTAVVARHIRDKRYGAAVTLLAYGAAGVAADLAQHVVDALKDPSKPGSWSSVSGAAVRLRGIDLLRQLYPLAVSFITRVLRDPAKVDALLGTLLEKAVVDLKSKAPAQLPAVETLPSLAADPVVLDRETIVPPEPIAPAGDNPERGSISLRALLALLVIAVALGAALSGCPNWQRPACGHGGQYSCEHDHPHYCAEATGELTPIGDEPCAAQGRVCEVRADGVARCAPRADAGLDADGGR